MRNNVAAQINVVLFKMEIQTCAGMLEIKGLLLGIHPRNVISGWNSVV